MSMSKKLQDQYQSSLLYGGNAAFIESQYENYLKDPESVTPLWRDYFRGVEGAPSAQRQDIPHQPIRESFARATLPAASPAPLGEMSEQAAQRQSAVLQMINAYRVRGHQAAKLDPLGLWQRLPAPDLDPAFHGFTEQDMDTVFHTGSLRADDLLPLRKILEIVISVYTGSIGAEYMHITDTREKRWIQQRLEGSFGTELFSTEERDNLLIQLTAAEVLEKYLHSRFVGQKRFSLEGGDALIPQLDDLIKQSARSDIEEVIIGMAHRGRLNVLVNILGKSPQDLFEEFEGKHDLTIKGSGDVKYHMGFSSDAEVEGKRIHLTLAFNPSHLEIVNPVVLGSVRCRQDRREDVSGDRILPVLIHGDAAFAGQGSVMEVLNMSQARGFKVGGTIHIIINNQVGFTTSNPEDARSTEYCSDLAKMIQAPIFHVNADDPEAVLFVNRLAFEYRMTFHKDVVIDLVCYRRHGHNEADEPAVTQPLMYKTIKNHPTARAIYADKLIKARVVDANEPLDIEERYRQGLDAGHNIVREKIPMIGNKYTIDWTIYNKDDSPLPAHTAISIDEINHLTARLNTLPEGMELHPRVERIIDDRRKMAAGALPADWGYAEHLAYGTLLEQGYSVRLVGQDCGRGTFFHRHAVLHNQHDGSAYIPLRHVSEKQGRFDVIDSLLSEAGVLGFEYGYSSADPRTLVIWEAQFGDFANNAQVVIDQFISSGEAKWQRICGLVMFLPHGYEGQGPEHSSARLERYLQLCAERNIQVCAPTTPAQHFHLLRRQMLRPIRKPLIVMTPKSLLRRRIAMSPLEDFSQNGFRTLIPEIDPLGKAIRRVVFCSGKVYYDLLEKRRDLGINNVALIRIEQLYPFDHDLLKEIMTPYGRVKEIVWCQEEPKNQGAWLYIQHQIRKALKSSQTLIYAGRASSASTAAGYYELHVRQLEDFLHDALGVVQEERA